MKKMAMVLCLMFAVVLCFNSLTFAQASPIKVEGITPHHAEEYNLPATSTGLKNVGVGELVYLSTTDDSNALTWSLESVPGGSAAALDSTDKQMTTFRPDVEGDYVVKLTSTGGDTTVTINAATYVGVGVWDALIDNPKKSNCYPCHIIKSTVISDWAQTGHASLFALGIDGIASDHYLESCIGCHTLGFNTDETAVNGGFDDVMKDLGWTFPAHPDSGEWAAMKTNYPKLAVLGSIQCENCHGPASQHTVSYEPEDVDISVQAELCGKCHDEPPRHYRNYQWRRSGHNYDQYTAAHGAPTNPGCYCHSASGFIAEVDGSIEHNPNAPGNVSCAACHDPHTLELRGLEPVTLENDFVVDFGGKGKLCMNCHKSRRDAEEYTATAQRSVSPHRTMTDMLVGTNAVSFGVDIPSGGHGPLENTCVTCHMAETPEDSPATDWAGDHTFAMSWDGSEGEGEHLSAVNEAEEIDNVNACKTCHPGVESFDDLIAKEDYDGDGTKEPLQEEVDGLLDELGKLLPPLDDPEVEYDRDQFTPVQRKAAYNRQFVIGDGSRGIHNSVFAINLLKITIEALTTGDLGAGNIVSITDVPNDNGKAVQIIWTRFGADGVSDDPVLRYGIWRKERMGLKKSNANVYASIKDVPKDLAGVQEGDVVMDDQAPYSFVLSVPAAVLLKYSANVPTLYDSTAAGTNWTTFKVSGSTMTNEMVWTAPDSGYSIDNLNPNTPTSLAATAGAEGVVLNWDEPVDEDFRYFAIYRNTASGFDPATMQPYATTTANAYSDVDVKVGDTYYYVVSAFDFSGNESAYTPEIALSVTSVTTYSQAVPTDYTLSQNYPNPFNPTTKIEFGLPKVDNVFVKVYNMQGKLVRTLAQGKFSAGYHSLVWDGRNEAGIQVSAGTYIYRLEAGDVARTQKMIFLK